MTALLQEYHMIAEHISDRNFPEDLLDKDMNFLADRKTYLLDIAKQGLTSDDYAHFKDLMDEFKIGYIGGNIGFGRKLRSISSV